jgi:hypothetical protein
LPLEITDPGQARDFADSERAALHLRGGRHTRRPFMSSDQFWSIFAMPIGLFLCFTPILIVWVRAERKDEEAAKKRGRR